MPISENQMKLLIVDVVSKKDANYDTICLAVSLGQCESLSGITVSLTQAGTKRNLTDRPITTLPIRAIAILAN